MRAVGTAEALDELVGLEGAAERERGGEEGVRAGEAGEVDDADGVRERELGGWGTVNLLQRIEVAWVVPAEVVEGLLDNILDLDLCPRRMQADTVSYVGCVVVKRLQI